MNRSRKKPAAYLNDITTLDDLIRKLNLGRIPSVAAIFFVFEVLNLVTQPFMLPPAVWVGATFLMVVCLLALLGIGFFYPRLPVNAARDHWVIRVFWLLLFAGMIPYFMHDIAFSDDTAIAMPLNITIFCAILIIVPVFSKKELIVVFSAFFASNMLLCVVYDAPLSYYVFAAGLPGAGFALAYLVQYQYVTTLWALKVENRADALTGVLNRRTGLEKMHATIDLCRRSGQNMAVYLLDIDYFKQYNDNYGHIHGDDALKRVAMAIDAVFSRATDVVCRFGGEEFLICALTPDLQTAGQMGGELLRAVEGLEIAAAENAVSNYLTVSIGYTLYMPGPEPQDTDVLSLIDKADAMMYQAKRSGRNQIMPPLEES